MKGTAPKLGREHREEYNARGSNVYKEAERGDDGFKHGGMPKHHAKHKKHHAEHEMHKAHGGEAHHMKPKKHVEHMHGEHAAHHAGRKPRKSGGGVLSSAASGTPRGKASHY